jgi:hypothetical protein
MSEDILEPPVELMAGPLDGSEVRWPSNKEVANIKYWGGMATYKLEGNGKAIYIKG